MKGFKDNQSVKSKIEKCESENKNNHFDSKQNAYW